MRAPSRRIVLTGAVAAAAIVIAGVVGCRALDRHHVATMLNISRLPASVSGIDCASYGFTDVLERCAFRIAPVDFHALLSGYHYQYVDPALCSSETPVGVPCENPFWRPRTSHTYGGGPAVGRDFAVAHHYEATPKSFEHGGSVTVLADRNRSMVMVDLYIE